jgi:hypothetical protein
VARAKPTTILARYRSNAPTAKPAPIVPRFWEETPTAVPSAKPVSVNTLDAVLDALEKATTPTDKVHAKKVELGWVSPDGRNLDWRYWTMKLWGP